MKNGVECYKDFFPYFKALKTNCGGLTAIFFGGGRLYEVEAFRVPEIRMKSFKLKI